MDPKSAAHLDFNVIQNDATDKPYTSSYLFHQNAGKSVEYVK